MSKDPAFLFYSSDFLTGTMLMSNEQVGQYIRLLCIQHQKGHMSEKDMLKICNTYDQDIFSKFRKDADGLFFNERLDTEISRRTAYSESRSQNRRKKSEDMNNICKSHDKHMETETEIEIETINKKNVKNERKDIYSDNPALNIAILEMIENRKRLRKPMTQRAIELMLDRLDKLATNDTDKIAIINQSIERGWSGVFEIKKDGKPAQPTTRYKGVSEEI